MSPIKKEMLKNKCNSMLLSFMSENVDEDFNWAIKNGAIPIQKPTAEPWGQIVSYVKDPNNLLVAIASKMK